MDKTNKLKVKKIVFISPEFPPGPGGIGTHTFQICKELAHLHYKVHVISPIGTVNKNDALSFDKEQIFPIKRLPENNIRWIQFFKRFIFVFKTTFFLHPDIIISSSYSSGVFSFLPQIILNIPRIAIGHGAEFGFKTKLPLFFTKLVYKHTLFSVAVSHYTKSTMVSLGLPKSKIYVIPNGADPIRFHTHHKRDPLKKEFNLKDKFVLMTVGRMCERKGQDIVIKALARLIPRIPNLVYMVIGHPQDMQQLRQLSHKLGVEKSIIFLPNIPYETLPNYYALADVYILNSRVSQEGDFEGFGISVLEAALTGIPAIGSKGYGIDDAIVEGKTGYLIPPNSVESIQNAILNLFSNDLLRQRMGEAARVRAASQFTWQIITQQYQDLIETKISQH